MARAARDVQVSLELRPACPTPGMSNSGEGTRPRLVRFCRAGWSSDSPPASWWASGTRPLRRFRPRQARAVENVTDGGIFHPQRHSPVAEPASDARTPAMWPFWTPSDAASARLCFQSGKTMGEVTGIKKPGTKKKWFQVTRFPALLTTGMHGTEHRIEKPCVSRRSAPPSPISRPRDRCLPAHRSLAPQRSRPLVTAFPSPATATPSQRPPFRGQRSRPATSRPASSFPRPVRLLLPCLRWFAPVVGSFFASGPLRLHSPTRSAASSASAPLRDFCLPRDRSVQQIPPLRGSPSELARFPLAPRYQFYY